MRFFIQWVELSFRIDRVRGIWVVLMVVAATVAHDQAWAQSTSDSVAAPEEIAAQHFEQGVQLYQEGSLDPALVEFERAYEAVPDYRLLYNIAQVQAQRGEYVDAIARFERYLSEGGRDIAKSRRLQVEGDLQMLAGRVAKLWVETNVAGAELYINGISAGTLPLEQPVLINAGLCEVRLEKNGYETRSHQLKVAGGEQPRLSLPLSVVAQAVKPPVLANPANPASKSAFAAPLDPNTETSHPNYVPFWISLASTGLLGAASATFAILALDSSRTLSDELDRLPADPTMVQDTRDRTKRFSLLADGFGAATVIAAGSAVYFLASPPRSDASTAMETGLNSLRVVPAGPGALVEGRF